MIENNTRCRVQFMIPTYNDIDEIDKTVESILNLDYDMNDIFVVFVDFGSTDGSYERLISMSLPHWGVYSRPFQCNWRQRICDGALTAGLTTPGGNYSLSMAVNPGDVLYKDFLKVYVGEYLKNYDSNPAFIVGETYVLDTDGNVIQQRKMRESNCVISTDEDMMDFISMGYTHNIVQMVREFSTERYKAGFEVNEGRWWNKLPRGSQERNIIYISEPLACIKEINYPDELEEILYRWEMTLSIDRFFSNKYGRTLAEGFVEKSCPNIAKYSLWRSFKLWEKEGFTKAAEDCFLIASVIDKNIVNEDIYKELYDLFYEKKGNASCIRQFYLNEVTG